MAATLGPPPLTEQKSQRLKGKARKTAKQVTAPQNGSDKQTSKPKYTLAVKDFISLSEHIAGVTDKTVEIPEYFDVALNRVISVRSSFSTKLEAAGEAVNQASDSRHNFFVTVLEKVRESLKPLTKSNALDLSSIKNATPRAGGDRARQSELRNLFEVLDVYEPSAEFLAAPDVVPSPSPVELEYTVEQPTDSIIEAFMAMTMLVNDLSRLRAEIADLWARHNTGELDLPTVSVATNAAIELAHSMEDEVYPLMKFLVETVPFHELYWTGICKQAGLDALTPQSPPHADDYNFQVYDIADALFINSRNALLVFLAKFQPPIMSYNGKWGPFDKNARQPPQTNREKYARDKSTL
ncbi:unnamed protein product [Alternaria alternata]